MGILDFLNDLISKDWEVDTRYEFFRVLFKEQNLDLIDYKTVMLLNSSIKNMKSYSTEDKNNYAFCTDKLIIRKSDKHKLLKLRDYYSSIKFTNSIVVKNSRLTKLENILKSFNKKDLSKIYLYDKKDINFIINQYANAPEECCLENLISYLDKSIAVNSSRRVLICSVIYMYNHEGLSISLNKKVKYYFTKDRLIRVKKFLFSLIK